MSRRASASERLKDHAPLSGGYVHVVAGAIIAADDRVLIAQRPAGKHLAGGWEFPGGKLNPGEDRETGLRRELREEIGIEVRRCRPLIRLRHCYPDRNVLLDVWLIDGYLGEPKSLDGQDLRWCAREDLAHADLLPADRPVVTALRLPERIAARTGLNHDLTAFDAGAPRGIRAADSRLSGVICESVTQALAAADAGADFIVIERKIPEAELTACCERIGRPVFAGGISLQEACAQGATGTYAAGPTTADRRTV